MTERLLQLIYNNSINNNNISYGFRNGNKTEMSTSSQQDKSAALDYYPDDTIRKIFSVDSARKIIETALADNVADFAVYEPDQCAGLCKKISIEIRDNIKQLNFDRYKIITTVQICEKRCQGLLSVARILCDKQWDRYATLSKETPSFIAVAYVFAIHLD